MLLLIMENRGEAPVIVDDQPTLSCEEVEERPTDGVPGSFPMYPIELPDLHVQRHYRVLPPLARSERARRERTTGETFSVQAAVNPEALKGMSLHVKPHLFVQLRASTTLALRRYALELTLEPPSNSDPADGGTLAAWVDVTINAD